MKWQTYIIMLVFSCISCGPELPDGDKLVKEIYDQKVSEFMSEKKSDCKQKALDDAESKVDSIIHDMLSVSLVDTLDFPTKPTRPSSPDHIIGTVKKFNVENQPHEANHK